MKIEQLLKILEEISNLKIKIEELEKTKVNLIKEIFNQNSDKLNKINLFNQEPIISKDDIHIENQIDESEIYDDSD
jgi:hypothetical protein